MRAFAGTGTAILASCALFAQTSASPPAFEVASVKLSTPDERVIGLSTYPGGRITATNYTLEMLIEEAYNVQRFQISGGPRWIGDDRYSIVAKPPASSASSKSMPPYPKWPPRKDQRLMLQTLLLLADRFHLQLHREMKEGPVYILAMGNKELKLKPAKSADDYPWVGSPEGGGISGTGMAATNASMQLLATRLTGYLRRPVLDQTKLKGAFDFKFDYAAEDNQPDVIASIFASLQGLGLKLEAAKGPIETLVIDHAEKPTQN
jgi:uncharacterized protein (TIGR03435 family)